MTQSNFEGMSRQELLAYVRQNPQDKEAFHRYMDLLQAAPGRVTVTTPEELEAEMRKRVSYKPE